MIRRIEAVGSRTGGKDGGTDIAMCWLFGREKQSRSIDMMVRLRRRRGTTTVDLRLHLPAAHNILDHELARGNNTAKLKDVRRQATRKSSQARHVVWRSRATNTPAMDSHRQYFVAIVVRIGIVKGGFLCLGLFLVVARRHFLATEYLLNIPSYGYLRKSFSFSELRLVSFL
jgi:hypothetical protein